MIRMLHLHNLNGEKKNEKLICYVIKSSIVKKYIFSKYIDSRRFISSFVYLKRKRLKLRIETKFFFRILRIKMK